MAASLLSGCLLQLESGSNDLDSTLKLTILVYPCTSNPETNDRGLVCCVKRVLVIKLLVVPTLRIAPRCASIRKPKFRASFLPSFGRQDVFSVLLCRHSQPYDERDASVERIGEGRLFAEALKFRRSRLQRVLG